MWRWLVILVCRAGLFFAFLYIPGAAYYVEYFGHALFYNGPVGIIGGFLLAPGVLFVLGVWRGILQQSSDPFGQAVNPALLVFIVVFSWVFWSTFISRSLKFIGLWNPFGSSVYGARPIILRAIVFISSWWEILTRFGRQATGGWAGILEVLSCRFKDGDIFLGRPRFKIGGGMLRPIGVPTEKHMVTIAGTGAGKSTGALIQNLCLHKGSLLCVDPKGELARITAARRGQGGGGVRGMGQDVYVLDPFKITGIESASYNVFDEMARIAEQDIDAPVSYAGKVAEALVESTGRDPYWDTAARRILMGLILYVFQGPAEKRNLVQVRRLLMEGDKEGFEAGVRGGYISRKDNDAFDAMLVSMQHCPPGPYRDTIAFAAGSLLQMGPNQLGSVLSTAQEHTAFLDLPEIRRISLSSDFLLEELKNRPMSVYLSIPLNAVSGVAGRWLRMFVLLLIDMMMRVQKAPKPPILLAIDEFPSLGKLDGIEVVAPGLRSYGVRFWVVGQDIEQFRKVYPDSWNTLIGGAEAVQFMGIKDPETVKMAVEFLNRHVIYKQEGEGQFRRNVAEERNLLDPDQVSQILYKARKNQIIWRGDRRPMMLKVTPYFEYMPWWYYSADTRYPEKWNRQIWRSGKVKPYHLPSYTDKPVLPPPKPPALPHAPSPPQLARPNLIETALREKPPQPRPAQRVPTNIERWDRARAAKLSDENFDNLMHLPFEEFNAGLDALMRGEKLPTSPFPADRPQSQIFSGSPGNMSEENRPPRSSPRKPRLPAEILEILKPPPVPGEGDPID